MNFNISIVAAILCSALGMRSYMMLVLVKDCIDSLDNPKYAQTDVDTCYEKEIMLQQSSSNNDSVMFQTV